MDDIKRRMNKGLTIGRIPSETYDWFVELANLEHCGDYGLTLKFLKDMVQGMLPLKDEQILARFEILEQDILALKSQLEKNEEKPKRKTLGGREIK